MGKGESKGKGGRGKGAMPQLYEILPGTVQSCQVEKTRQWRRWLMCCCWQEYGAFVRMVCSDGGTR